MILNTFATPPPEESVKVISYVEPVLAPGSTTVGIITPSLEPAACTTSRISPYEVLKTVPNGFCGTTVMISGDDSRDAGIYPASDAAEYAVTAI